MRALKILHSADLHLDSAFEALPAGKAAVRRAEQRQLLQRLASLATEEKADIVLLSGDLLDSDNTYYETGRELIRALGSIPAPVFIAPGNHDYYSARSPYARLKLPENVHIFTKNTIECCPLPELHVNVYGAAFTDRHSGALLENFHAEKTDGTANILCIHGEVGVRESVYDPVSFSELAASGLDYAAFGHVHAASGLLRAGDTWYAWPGCPEGRGFDETGSKTVNIVELSDEGCTLRTADISMRRYEILTVDVTACDPLLAVHTSLPDDTVKDIYRIILTGESDTAPELSRLHANLDEMFFALQLRDETRPRISLWEHAGDDTLKGIFLSKLKAKLEQAFDDSERTRIEQAARWGLAALDKMEEVVIHEDQ